MKPFQNQLPVQGNLSFCFILFLLASLTLKGQTEISGQIYLDPVPNTKETALRSFQNQTQVTTRISTIDNMPSPWGGFFEFDKITQNLNYCEALDTHTFAQALLYEDSLLAFMYRRSSDFLYTGLTGLQQQNCPSDLGAVGILNPFTDQSLFFVSPDSVFQLWPGANDQMYLMELSTNWAQAIPRDTITLPGINFVQEYHIVQNPNNGSWFALGWRDAPQGAVPALVVLKFTPNLFFDGYLVLDSLNLPNDPWYISFSDDLKSGPNGIEFGIRGKQHFAYLCLNWSFEQLHPPIDIPLTGNCVYPANTGMGQFNTFHALRGSDSSLYFIGDWSLPRQSDPETYSRALKYDAQGQKTWDICLKAPNGYRGLVPFEVWWAQDSSIQVLAQITKGSMHEKADLIHYQVYRDGSLSLSGPESPEELQAFPNPGINSPTIQGLTSSQAYKIYSSQGQLVGSGMAEPGMPLDVSEDLSPGFYLIEIGEEKGRALIKWVKQ